MADNGFITNFDFSEQDFEIGAEFNTEIETRYMKAKKGHEIKEECLYFSNAQKCAKQVDLSEGTVNHILLAGNFIFGDLIEALLTQRNIKVKHLIISTLSYNNNNIDSFRNLIEGGYIEKIDLIISDYFFANERNNLIKYAYQELDHNDRFQLAVASMHTKVCLLRTQNHKVVIYGSANLRSSNSVEQITIETNAALFDFYEEYHLKIADKYKTINQSIRNKPLWKLLTYKQ